MDERKLVDSVIYTTDEEEDPITLPLEDVHPSSTRESSRSHLSFSRGTKKRSSINSKAWCMRVLFLAVFIILFVISFSIGFFAGHGVGTSAASKNSCPTSPPSSLPTSAPTLARYNWGDRVDINGDQVDVLSWLDENMSANNMKNNLA